jgi:Icc-related predicted phosphoesterase
MKSFFVTDLHGNVSAFRTLFRLISEERPGLVFIGGDLLSGGFLKGAVHNGDVLNQIIAEGLQAVRDELQDAYPHVFIIMGNDDPRSEEPILRKYDRRRLWHYINQKQFNCNGISVYGYSYVPPSPFLNKDWERYDVSAYVDIGCISPEEGYRSVKVSPTEIQTSTIQDDLQKLTEGRDLSNSVFLFHAPPYDTGLDRAPLDGRMIDFVPLDVHVGSIAIRRFIEERQPLVTLHGHIHESYELTGVWKQVIGNTVCLSAASTGKALTLVRFDTDNPHAAHREEIPA